MPRIAVTTLFFLFSLAGAAGFLVSWLGNGGVGRAIGAALAVLFAVKAGHILWDELRDLRSVRSVAKLRLDVVRGRETLLGAMRGVGACRITVSLALEPVVEADACFLVELVLNIGDTEEICELGYKPLAASEEPKSFHVYADLPVPYDEEGWIFEVDEEGEWAGTLRARGHPDTDYEGDVELTIEALGTQGEVQLPGEPSDAA